MNRKLCEINPSDITLELCHDTIYNLLRLMNESGYAMRSSYIGVEIGASKHQIALGDSEGNLLHIQAGKVVLEEGAEGILAWMKQHIPAMIAKAQADGYDVKGIGIGFGGIVESESGRVMASVQVAGWENFGVRGWFEDTFKLPAQVLNDTVAGGYGEYFCGVGQGARNLFYTNIGSGIGGTLIFEGHHFDGLGRGTSYFGHTYVPDWTGDKPGAFDKVESLCSGFGLQRRLRREGYVPQDSMLLDLCKGDRTHITGAMFGEAVHAGDRFALEELDRYTRAYAVGLSNVITLFSVDRVVIGGGVAKIGEALLEPIRARVEEIVFFPNKGCYDIRLSALMDDAVLVGAVMAAAGRTQVLGAQQ